MKRAIVLLGAVLLLSSCGTTGGSGAGVDWKALESSAETTGQMEFLPEIEIYNLRISAFRIGSSAVDRAPDVMVLSSPRTEPFGVYLGNGLAIDSDGNVFLDVLKLLRIDTSQAFTVTCEADDRSGTITMRNDGNETTFAGPRGKGTVVQGDDGFALKPPTGKAIMRVSKAGGTYTYTSTLSFDPSAEMKANEDRISVKSGIRIDSGVIIEWQGSSIAFNPSANTTWPSYLVSKTGDTYVISYISGTARITFKVYFSGSTVYVVRNRYVLRTVTVTDSAVLVNGKEVVTYSR